MKYIINQYEHFKSTKQVEFKLNKETFDVIVPYKALLGPNDRRILRYVNGVPEEQDYNMSTKVLLNIEQMLDVFLDGYYIRLVFEEDAKKIYDSIQSYLNSIAEFYKNNIEHMYNFDTRIHYLDKFADSIYTSNKEVILTQPYKNNLDDFVKIEHYKTERIKSIEDTKKEAGMLKNELEDNSFAPFIAQNINLNNNIRRAKDVFDETQPVMDFNKTRESSYSNIERIKLERAYKSAPSEMSLVKDEKWI